MHPSELATTHVRRAAARAVLTAALLLGALGVFSSPAQALQPGCTQSGPTVTCTYSSSSDAGMTTQFTVPSGISSLHVLAVGSAGGGNVDLSGKDPTCSPLCGGRADRVTADLAVSSGQVLGVDVAGDPNSNTGGTNGFGNGGGGGCNGGGGASGVADSFFSVFSLVAAGGGGEGCNGSGAFTNDPTTAGGDAGVAGSSGLNSSQDGGGGAAGTTTGGGAAGAPSSGSFPANGGTLQNGGGGGSGLTSGSNVGGPGGGGGSGYWGGGGGGGGASSNTGGFDYAGSGGGGGGGGSLIPAGGSHVLDTTKHPEIVISYTVPSSGPGGSAPGGSNPGGSNPGGSNPGGSPAGGGSSTAPTEAMSGLTASSTGVSFELACRGTAGSSCHLKAQLSTLERLLGRNVLALVARKKHHSRRVVVAQTTFTVPAGQTRKVTLRLNARGAKLLRRFGKLPVTLTITLLNSNPPTVLHSKTTIRRKAQRHKRHH